MVPSHVRMVRVESSNLGSVGYDAATYTLWIEFKNNDGYRYDKVPANVHKELMSAASVGSYFTNNIRSKYKYEKVK
jgi:hypothetical protein